MNAIERLKVPILYTSLLFTLASIVLGTFVIIQSIRNQYLKIDYAEANHIKYGLFSVNEWKKQLIVVVTDEISNFDLTRKNKNQLKKHVEKQLSGLIDQVENKIKESNKGSFKGWVKQSVINSLVDVNDIKSGVPQYADAVVKQMTSPKSEKTLKNVLADKVKDYFDKTFEVQDHSKLDDIMSRTGTKTPKEAREKLTEQIASLKESIFTNTWVLIGLSVVLFALATLTGAPLSRVLYFMLIVNLMVLLAAGVMTPMIDMEAKISEMSFILLDHPVGFTNQVLYFQTKSILDVFWIMITHPEIKMKAVGLLMVAFSVVFPVLKMLSSYFYFFNIRGGRKNRWIKFFVLKSGKWSMADVLVVAMFMAYIGFNGVISSQFANFSTEDKDLVLIATNGTALQSGFYIFLTYAILALFLSVLLKRSVAQARNPALAETLT